MWISGQFFNTETVSRIREEVEREPSLSRRALSRRVCEWLDWRSANGRLQEMSCRKALSVLDRRGLIRLPKAKGGYAFERRSRPRLPEGTEIAEGTCNLAELGEIEIVPVSSRSSKASRIWNWLMAEYHYLGKGPLCGAQIRYLVHSSVYGWLGGLSFSAGTWRLKDRDEWIGWSEGARRANLQRVVCNSRFLIVPTVRVPNLASHVLSRCLSRLGADWEARYGYAPVLVETFIDPERFAGTCYRAANWTCIGETAGRSDGYRNGKVSSGRKAIYVKPLCGNWRSVLRREPETALGMGRSAAEAADWVEEEFGRVRLYDERLRRRLFVMTKDFFARPGVLVPEACEGSEAKTKGAYRFLENAQVDLKTLLRSHVEATVERVREQGVVLAVQDTTTLNYTSHRSTEGLGPINTTQDGGEGLVVHDTVAFTQAGTPLGVLDAQCWARDPEEAGKRARRKALPIEAKESYKWLRSYGVACELQRCCPETMVVSVGDREADIYELFYEAVSDAKGAKLLVRAERSRNRKVDETRLWDRVGSEDVSGYQEIYIPGKGQRRARTAKLAVRYARVRLEPPRGKALPGIELWAVYAEEVEYASNVASPVEWMLLTTVEVRSFEEAAERLRWYAQRWGIEVYHRTLKSGCRIQDRCLRRADRLEACLAIDMVVAWRIFFLTKQGRETPDIPCDVFLSEEEWKALYTYKKRELPPSRPPSLREVVRMIASLGGFLGRKGDGEPGTTTMWRGLERLEMITEAYIMFKSVHRARASP